MTFNLFFMVSFPFWLGGSFMAPIIYGVTPSVPAEAGCLFAVVARVHVFISGESL